MKSIKIILFLFFTGILINSNKIYGSVLLEANYGARPISLGDCFVAIGDEPVSVFWNPAAMPEPAFYGIITIGYQRKLSDMNQFEFFGTSKKFLNGYWGLGFVYWSAEEQGYNEYNEPSVLLKAKEFLVAVAYKRSFFGIMSAGATIKLDRNTIVDDSETAIALDIGARSTIEGIGIGFLIKNIGIGAESIPMGMVLGGSYPVFRKGFHKILVTAELSSVQGIGFIIKGGAEYSYRDIGFFRIGYNAIPSITLGLFSKFRFGIGGKYYGANLNYAFLPYGRLGYTHEVNISYNLDRLYKKTKKDEIKPTIKLLADKNIITGVGDKKSIIFTIEAKDESAIRSWEFRIKDKKGNTIYIEKEEELENVRFKLKQIEWAGISQITKSKVEDGKYSAEAKVVDYGGNLAIDTIDEIIVSRSRYAAIIGLSSDVLFKGDRVRIYLVKKPAARQKSWKLIIKNEAGNVVFTQEGKGKFEKFRWNGKDAEGNYLPKGKYKIQVEITFVNNEKTTSNEVWLTFK